MNSDLSPKFPLEIPVDMPSAAEIEGQISEIVAKGIQKESLPDSVGTVSHRWTAQNFLRHVFHPVHSIVRRRLVAGPSL